MSNQVVCAPGFLGVPAEGVDRKRAIREAVQDVFSRRRLTSTATSGRLNRSCHTRRSGCYFVTKCVIMHLSSALDES